MALAVAGTILMATALRGYAGGRAVVDSMYDTNDLAYVLVTVFPIAVAFTIVSKSTRRRLTWAAIVLGMVITILLTSSRGGFLGLLAAAPMLGVPSFGVWAGSAVGDATGEAKALSILASVLARLGELG
jgi:hypothetical protein